MGALGKLLVAFLFASCATEPPAPYLFARGKQRHDLVVADAEGVERTRSQSFVILRERDAHLTILSPVQLTLVKVEFTESGREHAITYLHPSLERQRVILGALINRIGKLYWARGTPNAVRVESTFPNGSARALEWTTGGQKITIRVEPL